MNEQHPDMNQYSTEDILRYLSGKMSREETRVFERNMLDDELLADSVDGFKLMRESLTDNQILEKSNAVRTPQISQKKESTPVVSISSSFRWLRYAAAACLVIAAGWWIFSITKTDEALNPDTGLTQSTEIQDSIAGDVAITENINEKESARIQTEDQAATEKDVKTDIAKKEPEIRAATKPDISETRQATIPSTPEKLLSDSGNAIASVSKENKRARTLANAEVIYNLKFKKIDTASASPATGWGVFKKYVENQLSPDMLQTPTKATIHVSPEGIVEKVEWNNSLSEEQKKEASQKIIAGPKWNNKTGKKAKAVLEW
ncbi:MAG: hypothetical protein MUE71_00225 [Chitinophagaceae bacterium]|nr:hypothetical protein [Chitinophagaceae bacterium]